MLFLSSLDVVIPGRLQDVHLLRRPDVPQGDRLSEGAAGGAQAQVPPLEERGRPRAQPEEGQAAATEQVDCRIISYSDILYM